MSGRKKAGLRGLSLVVVVLAGAAFVLGDQPDKDSAVEAEDMTFAWTAPTSGTPVVKYEVQIRKGGMNSTDITTREVTTNQVTFSVDWLTLYEVRVRGIDAQDRAGPWSIWSLAEDRDHEDPSF